MYSTCEVCGGPLFPGVDHGCGGCWYGYIPSIEDPNDYVRVNTEGEDSAAEMVAEMYCEGRLTSDLPSSIQVNILHSSEEAYPIMQSPWKEYVVEITPTIVFHATLKRYAKEQ